MNSLQDLNSYSSTSVTFTDERSTAISYDTTATGTIFARTMTEGQDLTTYVGANITSVINPEHAIEYRIDMSAAPGAVLVWQNFPTELTHTTSNDVHVIGNITSSKLWDQVKEFTVDVNADFYKNNWAYSSSITYDGAVQRNWNNYFEMATDLPEVTVPTAQAYTATIGANTAVISYPQITDTNNPVTGTYTMAVGFADWASSVYSGTGMFTSTSAVGGTSVWNSTTKTLTITGTRAEVNDRLAHLTFTCLDPYSLRQTSDPLPDADSADAFDIEYRLTNPSGLVTRVCQHFYNNAVDPYKVSETFTGNINTVNAYAFSSNLDIPKFDTTPVDANNYWIYYTFQLTGGQIIYPATAANIEFVTQSTNYFSIRSWINTNPVGTRTAVNNFLSNLVIAPNSGVSSMRYSVIMSGLDENYWRNDLQIRTVPVADLSASKLAGFNGYLQYYKNTSTKFASNILLTDYYPNANHNVTITSNIGTFSIDGINDTQSIAITGNVTTINNKFANLAYYPPKDYTGNVSFILNRTRDGVLKEIIENSIFYNAAAVSSPGITTMTITSNTTVPVTLDQRKYLRADVILVGGGGAVGRSDGYGRAAGGGAGGNVAYWSNLTTSSNAMIINIGSAGQLSSDYTPQLRNGGQTNITWTGDSITVFAGGGTGGGNGATSGSYGGGDSQIAIKTGSGPWNTNVYTGGSAVTANVNWVWGGGGAGAGGAGGSHGMPANPYGGLGGAGWTNTITNTVVSRGGTGFYSNVVIPTGYGNGGYIHTIANGYVAASPGVVFIKYHV